MTIKAAWAEITKTTKLPDGSVLVEGRLGGPTRDLDGEALDKAWLDKAVPKWAERGNIRAMHQPIAAGKAQEVTDTGSDWHLVGKIVDPIEVNKVLNGVYTGWSVGIKNTVYRNDPISGVRWIKGGDIIEVSLADFPCDPTNKLSLIEKGAMPTDDDLAAAAAETTETDADKSAATDEAATPPPVSTEMTVADLLKMLTPDTEKKLSKGQMDSLAKIREAIDNVLQPAPPEVEEPEAKADEPAEGATKVATFDTAKVGDMISSAITKAVTSDSFKAAVRAEAENLIKPIRESVAEIEKRAAPGGPIVGPKRQLQGSDSHKAAMITQKIERASALLEHPDPKVAQGARDLLDALNKE